MRSRIDKMGRNVENKLVEKLKCIKFSLQLDESTVRRGEALLMAYVRYIEDGKFCEEMMFYLSLKQGTTSNEIFKVLDDYLQNRGIPYINIISCSADGASSMQGKKSGCLKLINDRNPLMMTIHCVIHRESLVAKNLSVSLNEILSLVIKCVNIIKGSAKGERLFKLFCESLSTDHVLLYFILKLDGCPKVTV